MKNGLLAVKCFCMNDETENGFKFASSRFCKIYMKIYETLSRNKHGNRYFKIRESKLFLILHSLENYLKYKIMEIYVNFENNIS